VSAKLSQLALTGGEQNLAFGTHAFLHAEAQLFGHNAWSGCCQPIVEVLPRLPANRDCVLEASGGYECDARAFSFKQGVYANCGSMPHFDDCSPRNLLNGREH